MNEYEEIMNQYQGSRPIFEFRANFRTGIWLEENCEGVKVKSRLSERELLVTSEGKVVMVSQYPAILVASMMRELIMKGQQFSPIESIDWEEINPEHLTLLDWLLIEATNEYLVLPILIS
jgi:hypothetical protein